MKKKISAYLSKIPDSHRLPVFYTILYVLTGIFYFMKSSRDFPLVATDSKEYACSFVYLIKTGYYFPDTRMPGYGLPFAIWYAQTRDYEASMTFMALFYGVVCITFIYLSILWFQKYVNQSYTVHLFGLSWTASISVEWWWLLPDPVTTVVVAAAFLLLLRGQYLASGFLQLTAFVMRPINILLYPLSILVPFIKNGMGIRFVKNCFYFMLPMILYEGAWIIRNYLKYGDFRPLYGNGVNYHQIQITTTYALYATKMTHKLGLNHSFTWLGSFNYLTVERRVPYFLSAYRYLDSNTVNNISEFFSMYYLAKDSSALECEYELKLAHLYDSLNAHVRLPRFVIALRSLYFGAFPPPNGLTLQNKYILYRGVFFLIAIFWATFLIPIVLWAFLRKRTQSTSIALVGLLYATIVPWTHALLGIIEDRYLLIWTPTLMMAIALALSHKGDRG